ncbi:hypothetical protein [Moorena sp. SIO3A5]|uniref:hypothetical protein n=1 Tax=Moorena sp. SIO3A5 TaxID=2607822 RepID=UPI002580C9F2|nr:hypothetical protein [Moorena sp. SIO3A5]
MTKVYDFSIDFTRYCDTYCNCPLTLPKENITNTQALQQAQLSWLLTPEYSHP